MTFLDFWFFSEHAFISGGASGKKKNKKICLPMQKTPEMWVRSLGWEGPLQEEMATHFSILAWEIPWREEPGGLQSMGLQESDTTEHACKRIHFIRSVYTIRSRQEDDFSLID